MGMFDKAVRAVSKVVDDGWLGQRAAVAYRRWALEPSARPVRFRAAPPAAARLSRTALARGHGRVPRSRASRFLSGSLFTRVKQSGRI
jgi:hypothetical protein